MKSSPFAASLLAAGLLTTGLFAASPTTAVAGEVYQWKDARGVTQYSSTPPPKGIYKTRTINHTGNANAAVNSSAKSAGNPQCVQARANVTALQGKGAVLQDSDGDGKGDKTLTDSERASQLTLAQATLSANNCTASAAASAPK